jgi:hypothetical protein
MATTEGYVTGTRSSGSEHDRRSSDEIRRSIEEQRDDLDVTAEVLQRKLAPRELAEQLWSDMRTRVSSGAGDMVDVVRRHPVPLGLIGAGIAWWVYETSSGRGFSFGNGGRRYEDENLGVGSMSTGSYRSGASYSGDYTSSEDESESDEKREGWRRRSVQAAQRSADRVRSGAHHARQGFSEAVDRNPLALGAACFSLGLLAAIAVPSSRWENATLGETRDRVARRAREAAKRAAVGAAEQSARAAQGAAERLKDEADRSSTSPKSGTSSASWKSGGSSAGGGDTPDPWDPNRPSGG